MRITAGTGPNARGPGSGGAAPAATGFTLGGAAAAPTTATVRAASVPSGLLALQDVAGGPDGRRRALKRGRRLVDRLDELRLGLLAGAVPTRLLGELRAALAAPEPATGDAALERLLAAIDLRCAVELAKLEVLDRRR